ncbi:hypothetical protein [Lysinibacillus odysseyi]|uniref:Coproporphyrinogen III oxidase n=1 Tax=Lysinibacillus odysseyi 34hs-1 = NBRC 100172 TaxID=1220589 RepID=A0A0A3IB01_9BACI|nr:hypothetical protein [Lysinibacillus odysseyi]KGR81936.1 hypothetical protein CD32_21780 [Lysinibacillus odysseyi 34hs-1 = NBRC 100172]
MALEHEFYLVRDILQMDGIMHIKEKTILILDSVIIDDDLILYISDSLKWLPSKLVNFQGMSDYTGIAYYGITLFDQQSAPLLYRIFCGWRDLFLNAPSKLELTGSYIFPDEMDDMGEYEKLVFKKEDVLRQFEKMITLAEYLANGNCYIYHIGI